MRLARRRTSRLEGSCQGRVDKQMNRRNFLKTTVGAAAVLALPTSVKKYTKEDIKARKIYYRTRHQDSGNYLLWCPEKKFGDAVVEPLLYTAAMSNKKHTSVDMVSVSPLLVPYLHKYSNVGRHLRKGCFVYGITTFCVSFHLEGISWCINTYNSEMDWYGYQEYRVEGLTPRRNSFRPDDFEKAVTSGDEVAYAKLMFG